MVKHALFSVVVTAVALGMVGCGSPPPTESPSAPEASAGVLIARDAAVTFVREHFDEAPAETVSWAEERLTPEGLIREEEWRYTAGDWVVKVWFQFVDPEWTVYHVTVSNQRTGLEWAGRVDGSGRASESPEGALRARDRAFRYLSRQHGLAGLGPGLAWQERRLTPESVVDAETYEYTTGDWVVTIFYPIVPPEDVVYRISVTNMETGFQWVAEVDVRGTVWELGGPVPQRLYDREAARDAALDHIYEQYQYPPLDESVDWVEERLTAEWMVGAETFKYSADSWVVEVSYAVVAPEATIYEVTVTNDSLGLEWYGEVDAQGVVTEIVTETAQP